MELESAPTARLLELQHIIREELRRRRPEEVLRHRMALKHKLRAYDDDLWREDQEANCRAVSHNGKHLLALRPSDLQSSYNDRVKYLKMLMVQDWSHLFESVSEGSHFYVYAHCDPRGKHFCGPANLNGITPGIPFYIGKGVGARAWDMKRNQGHGLRIKEVLGAGYAPHQIVHVFDKGLAERAALEMEAKLVYFFGTIYEEGRKGILLNLDLCKRPTFVGVMEKLISVRMLAKTRGKNGQG